MLRERAMLKGIQENEHVYIHVFFSFLAMPHSLQDLRSLTRKQSPQSSVEAPSPNPLDRWGSPHVFSFSEKIFSNY